MKRCGSKLIAALLVCIVSITTAHGVSLDPLTLKAIEEAVSSRGSAQAANNLRRILAVWIGRDSGCDIVAIESSMRPGVSYSYRVCGDVIQEVGDVPPAAPNKDPMYHKIKAQAQNRAMIHGSVTDWFDGYRIRAMRVGPPRADGCALVETLITHGPHLVERLIAQSCP